MLFDRSAHIMKQLPAKVVPGYWQLAISGMKRMNELARKTKGLSLRQFNLV